MHIIKEWVLAEKKYLVFEHSGETFLYYSDHQGIISGLMKGLNFEKRIEELLKEPDKCIECSICDLISVGISVDNGEIVEFGLTVKEANTILGKPIFPEKTNCPNN
jgi:hypothetical protein